MDSWYQAVRSDWVIADLFEEIWFSTGGPKDAALFGSLSTRDRQRVFYFNPGAVRLAPDMIQFFKAVKCPPPDFQPRSGSPIGIVLLVGDQSILEGNG